MSDAKEADASSVVVLLDVSAAGWTALAPSESGGALTLRAAVEAVVVFLNAVQVHPRGLRGVSSDCRGQRQAVHMGGMG
jgi:hypothetical protein